MYGLPEEWDFDYGWELVRVGFWLWAISGFQRLPTQDEIMAYDKRWVSDMDLAYEIYRFYKNDSPVFGVLENWLAQRKQREARAEGNGNGNKHEDPT